MRRGTKVSVVDKQQSAALPGYAKTREATHYAIDIN